MTIKEIRDLFLAQYDIQAQVRGLVPIKIVDKMLASFISQAQQDIQRRLLVIETSVDITLSTTSNVHSLPTNFGQHKHAYSGNYLLDEKPGKFIREQLAIGNSGYWFGIYPQGNTTQLITPLTSGTLTLFYYPDLRYYQPSVSSSQDWGNFSGTVFSGKLILPDRYDMAILYYMLAQVLPDYWNLYEKEVRSLRGSRLSSMDSALGYELGGVNEAAYYDVLSTTSSTTTASVPTDTADKKIRFRVSDGGGDATVEYEDGWTTTPTIVNNVSTVVVTSADSEFTNWVHVEANNEDFSWAQIGATTITLTPPTATGWGSVEIIIEVWN